MAAMAGTCSSSLIFRNGETGGNGASMLQYNGLRPMENKQAASNGTKPNGFISSSGLILFPLIFSFVEFSTFPIIFHYIPNGTTPLFHDFSVC